MKYIQKNVHLYQFKNGIPLTTSAAANFIRNELTMALRKESGRWQCFAGDRDFVDHPQSLTQTNTSARMGAHVHTHKKSAPNLCPIILWQWRRGTLLFCTL